ncbi:MAG: response regulator [Sporomusaceae bacterium]|nr:response regulator [Sporomusaceae bacterium]
MKILIVDDSGLSRAQLRSFFEKAQNVQFDEAVNGIDALEKQRSFQPDIIFLDYIIPAPDGLAVLKIISQIDEKVKIFMITTLGNQQFLQDECQKWGAAGVITKPLSQEAVVKAMTKLFKSQS